VGALSKGSVWPWLEGIYHYAWFFGFVVSGFGYYLMMSRLRNPLPGSIKYKEAVYHVDTH
jgi:cytosine/uracil/thiamine/allantoin permease